MSLGYSDHQVRPASAERILIIDQNAATRQILDRYLVNKGYYVQSCADLNAALRVLSLAPCDLIFADLEPAAIRELISLSGTQGAPVSLIACGMPQDAQDVVTALRAGASDYLIKPYADQSAIDDVLTKLLDRLRLYRLNQTFRKELEEANGDLRDGISELRADQNAGRKVQLRMLPEHQVSFGPLMCDHLIKPSLYLSGDFLDYFKIDDDRMLVYIADVSGHGASSAFVTVLLKNLMNRLQRNWRRQSSDDVVHPDRFLQRINAELLDTGLGKHLTLFVGIINHKTHQLRYAVGAHFPMPVLVSAEGARFLEGSGLPIGLFESPEWEVLELDLPEKFSLVLFSDGILELIKAKNLDAKEQRLLEVVRGGGHTIAALSHALDLDEVSELPDDIAVVLVTNQNDWIDHAFVEVGQ